MQRTIVYNYDGQKIVSQPFTFIHACIMDDLRYKCKDENIEVPKLRQFAYEALKKMFEGTIVTDEGLDNGNIKEIRIACDKIIDWYLGINEEIKNSSRPGPEKAKETGA